MYMGEDWTMVMESEWSGQLTTSPVGRTSSSGSLHYNRSHVRHLDSHAPSPTFEDVAASLASCRGLL